MFDVAIIDGSNMCHRVHWANKNLSSRGRPVGCSFGFLKSLAMLKRKWPGAFFMVVWDHRSKRRMEETVDAKVRGLIPGVYKGNRTDRDEDPSYVSLLAQMEQLRGDILPLCAVLQVRIDGYEADDIAYTYAKAMSSVGKKVVLVTSDMDWLQSLFPGVSMYDAMKQTTWNEERVREEYGFGLASWLDYCALCGDKSDNIFGVPGWGPVNASKYIRAYGSIDALIAGLQEPGRKLNAKEQAVLDHLPRLRLAKVLKTMDIVPNLPKARPGGVKDARKLQEVMIEWQFTSLLKDAEVLTR